GSVWGGVSMGGCQSLLAVLRHPERVAGLIMIDSQGGAETPELGPMYEAAADLAVENGWTDDTLQLATGVLFGASATDEVKGRWVDGWKSMPTEFAPSLMKPVTRR